MKTMVKIWVSCVMLFLSFNSFAQDEARRLICVEDHEKVSVMLSWLAVDKGVWCKYLKFSNLHEHQLSAGIHICEAKSKEEIFIMSSGVELADAPNNDKCMVSVIVAGSSNSMSDIQLTMEDIRNIDIYNDGDSGYLEHIGEDATAYFASFHPKFHGEYSSSKASEESQRDVILSIIGLWNGMNSSWQDDKKLFWRRWMQLQANKVLE